MEVFIDMAPFFSRLAVGGLVSKFGIGRSTRGIGTRKTMTFTGPGSSTTSSTPFFVPFNSPSIIITCEGEYGGSGPGGAGGLVSASFAGLAGQTLVVSFAGGGPGASSNGYRYTRPAALSRGGHYAGVFVSSVSHANSLIIAGGGGAGGFADVSSGGAGGGSTGNSGSGPLPGSGSGPGVVRVAGGGGTQSSGGAGGSGYEGTAGSGSALSGGSGYSSDISRSSSGSGGGGYYGGGGGGSGYDSENYASSAGGGGGSGYIRNDGSTISNITGGSTSPAGKVIIEYYE